MPSLIGGIIIGILLSVVAIIIGKKYSPQINAPHVSGKAQIVSMKKDLISEITHD